MKRNQKSGFSLVELAIVMTIIALILSLAVSGLRAQLANTELTSTQDKIAAVKLALENFYSVHNYFPCPSSPNITQDNASYGVAPASCRSACPSGESCVNNAYNSAWKDVAVGDIPHVTLNIPIELTIDAYGSKMSYALDPKNSLTDTFCEMDGALTVQDFNNNAITNKAMYVIISAGEDRKGAYKPESGTIPIACNTSAKDGENCDGNDLIFRSGAINKSSTAASYYDDIIGWGLNKNAKSCPAGLSNCAVWIDAADRCTVIANTGGVQAVFDKSPNALVATQSNSANRPEYTTVTVNGRRSFTFVAANTDALYVGLPSTTTLNITPYTYVSVFATTATGGKIATVTNSATFTAGGYERSHLLSGSSLQSYIWNGSVFTITETTGGRTSGRPHMVITTVGPISNYQMFVNGKLEATGTYTTSAHFSENTIILGSHLVQSSLNLLEYIYFNKELTTSERKALELYLVNKWGILY